MRQDATLNALGIGALTMQCPPELSQRAVALKPSLTLEISAKAKALQNDGRDICSLSAGEPDFNTPEFITEAAREALANGITLARGEGDEPPPDADGDDDGAALLGVFLQGAGGDGKRQLEFSEERSLRESGLWPQASLVVSELGG